MSTERVSDEVLSRPRLGTFEELIRCDDLTTKENRTRLFEDFLEIKHELKSVLNSTNAIDNTNELSDNSISS